MLNVDHRRPEGIRAATYCDCLSALRSARNVAIKFSQLGCRKLVRMVESLTGRPTLIRIEGRWLVDILTLVQASQLWQPDGLA